jgi:DNA-binding MarR family transcriptional regulator
MVDICNYRDPTATVATVNHGDGMPDSDAERLETLLTTVMRLVALHADDPPGGVHGGMALPMAEGVLLVELLSTGQVTQQQMADRLHIHKSRASRLCAGLERKDLLSRERDESNRRKVRLRLTPLGARTARQLRENLRHQHERMLAAMTPQERQGLLLGLAALGRELAAIHQEARAAS